MHVSIDMRYDDDAYNAVGEHLENDDKQSRWMSAALVIGAVLSIAFLLWMMLGAPPAP